MFYAEVLAILEAAKAIEVRELPRSRIVLYSDSRAALGALAARITYSKLVRKCLEILNIIALRNHVELCWVRGHSDVEGNEMANGLARAGSALDRELADSSISTPMGAVKSGISKMAFQMASYRWEIIEGCRTTKRLWPVYDRSKTRYLLTLARDSLRLLTGAITGHCLIWEWTVAFSVGAAVTRRRRRALSIFCANDLPFRNGAWQRWVSDSQGTWGR